MLTCACVQDFPASSSDIGSTTTSRLATSIVGHAQASLDNAQENWKSLLPDIRGATEDGAASHPTPFPFGMSALPGLEAVLKHPEQHFGDLWGASNPQFGPFKVLSAIPLLCNPPLCSF